MYKLLLTKQIHTAVCQSSLGSAVNRVILPLIKGIMSAFMSVNRRALNTISTTLVLSVLLSACGGGGGGGGSSDTTAPPPDPATTPTLTISTPILTLNEDFSIAQVVAITTNVTSITFNQSATGVVIVTTSVTGVSVSSILNANGRTTLTITASDGTTNKSAQVVVIVTPVNDPPTLSVSSNNISTVIGFSTITINTTASDVEDDNLSYAVTASAAGVVRVTTSANAIMLNAINGASGQTTLTVRVVDSSGSTVTQIITVNVIMRSSVAAPVVTVSTNMISVQEDFRGTVVFQTTATDADGDTITLTVSSSSHLVDAVLSSPFSAKSSLTNSITLTAIANANGTTTLTVQVSDAGGQSESTEIVVVVTAVEDTPTLTITTAILTVAEDFAGATTLATAFDDDDGDSLSFSVVESTTGVVSVTTSASEVQVERIGNANGNTTLTITVSDGTLSATAQVVVTVTPVNDPPTLSVATTTVTLNEDFATIAPITLTIGDLENDTLTLTVTESNTGVVTVTTTATTVQLANIAHASGVTTLTIVISDGSLSSTAQVGVTVLAVNDTPTLSVSTNSISANVDFSTITINTTASDVEDSNLSFSVTASAAGVVRVTTSANAIVLNAISGASGQTTLTVRVVDSSGTAVTQIISVNVIIRPSVAAPVVTVSTNMISVQEDFRGSVVFQTTATDADGDTITLSVSSSSHLVDAVLSSPFSAKSSLTNSITLTAIANANGTTTLTVQASDAGGQSDSTEIVVVVTAVEDMPTLTITTAILTVAEDFAGATTLATAFDNDDGDSLSFSVVESTTGVVTVTTSASGVQVEHIANANGNTTLTITVSDGTLSATAQVVVTVTPVNDPPTLSVSTTAVTLNEDFATIAPITLTIGDLENDTLTLTVTESNTGVVTVTTTATTVQLANIAHASGVTTLTIVINDGSLSSTAQVGVTVLAVNDTPTLSVSTNSISANVDFSTITINTTASDVEDSNLSFSVTASAAGVVRVTTSTNAIVLNAISGVTGQTTLTVRVVDSSGTAVTQTIKVSVNFTAIFPPELSVSTNAIIVREDFRSSVVIRTTATDADGNTLTLSVNASTQVVNTVISGPISGMSTLTNSITLTAIGHANGITTLTVSATDASGQSTSTKIVVMVRAVNDPPTIDIPAGVLTLKEDFEGNITLATVNNVDDDTITISVLESPSGIVNVTTTGSNVQISNRAHVNGMTTLAITVSDSVFSLTVNVVVTVTAVNDTPTFAISTTAISLTEDFSNTVMVASAMNVDDDTITISVLESTTGVVNVTTANSNVQLMSRRNANGVTTLTLTVSDGQLSSTLQVSIIVSPVNDSPTITISQNALIFFEDFKTISTITANIADLENDTLTFSVTESTTGVVNVTTSASAVHIASIADANGRTTLTLRVTDTGGLFATTDVVVIVNAVNDTPTLTVSTNNILVNGGFSPITINTTAGDDVDTSLSFAVQDSNPGVIRVTTSANAIVLSPILGILGQTTLTVRTIDTGGLSAMQIIAVNVVILDSATPMLTVSTQLIIVDEDFATPVVIRTTATDTDSREIILSIRSSSRTVNAVISTPVNMMSPSTSLISLSAITDLNGTTTLTIQATDDGGQSTTTEIVVVVNPVADSIPFTLSTSVITLTVPGSQLERHIQNINIRNLSNSTLRAQIQVMSSGDPIFSPNPIPVVSFTTNALTTVSTLTAATTTHTAQLYFTIAPTKTGTATLSVQITNLATSERSQQTLEVRVNTVDVPPVITQAHTSLQNIRVFGGHLYANSATRARGLVTPFVNEARALGGHLFNFNTVREFNFVHSPTSGFITNLAWIGLASGRVFPSEFYWVTNDSTIAYGYAADNGTSNLTVYPGHYALVWHPAGLNANRANSAMNSNWTVYDQASLTYFLIEDSGDNSERYALYEFPNGLAPASINTIIPILAGSSTSVRLTGYDLNGDSISLSNWTSLATTGTTIISNVNQTAEVQTVDLVYTAPASYSGQTTVVVTLTVNGLNSTTAIVFTVDGPPNIDLSTNTIVLAEEFTNYVIGATVTDRGVSGILPFSVQASSTGIVNISTSANTIQFSGADNFNGVVTLTVNAIDSASLNASALVVVTVLPVNDTPTLTVSTNSITTLGGFSPIFIGTTATDVDGDSLTFNIAASASGIVSITTLNNTIVLSPIAGGSGRTTLTIKAVDTANTSAVQTIAVNVIVTPSAAPMLTISTNYISILEDFNPNILIRTTATDPDQATDPNQTTLVITVSSFTYLVDGFISSQGITLSPVDNISGTTTLTVRAADVGGLFVSTEIVVIVQPVNDTPTFNIPSTTLSVSEDFATRLVATASDVDGDTLIISVTESSTGVVNVTTSTTIVNISSILNAHGQTTLTITASDGKLSRSTQVAITVNPVDDPISLTLSTSIVTLSALGGQFDRNIQSITINNPDNENLRAQLQLTSSGSPIFSTNPAPVVSFTTNALTNVTMLNSSVETAQLYFTIAPNQTGAATLTLQLTNQTRSETTQQTMVVQVNSVDVPPMITRNNTNLQNLIVNGGHLYANPSTRATGPITPFLTEVRALGGHLVNINSVEEFNFLSSPTISGLNAHEAWIGLVLPNTSFPGELSWVTHDSTIAYGFANGSGITNLTVYPGQYALNWHANGLNPNSPLFNWAIYEDNLYDQFFLVSDAGNTIARTAIYEFPNGLAPASNNPIPIGSSATIRLTGIDLNRDAITTANWSATATTGTTSFSNIYQSSGVQAINLVYTPPSIFTEQSTVVVTLQTNGLSTSTTLVFDSIAPTFTLASTSIVLIENSSQTIRNQQLISNIRFSGSEASTILNSDYELRVTHSGDPIFSPNPAPVVSFTTNALTTTANIGSTAQTAQLYFTIGPDQFGTATLTVQLASLGDIGMSQQTIVVQVNQVNAAPVIARASTNLQNLRVHGGNLYANSATRARGLVTPFVNEARAWGGHLININSVREFNFVHSPTSGFILDFAWIGLASGRVFPSEFSWVTNDSTIAYGYAAGNGINNLTVYPGHYVLSWHSAGLNANRANTAMNSNWTVYDQASLSYFLIEDSGDNAERYALYEFPNGLAHASVIPITILIGSSATISLTGIDLNGATTINTSNWSATATTGSVSISSGTQYLESQTVNIHYTPSANFVGQSTVVVNLLVNGLNTTSTIQITVDGPPVIALSTYTITLDEEFTNFVIGTTVTDIGVSGNLPFSVQFSSTGIVNITTSANSIQFSGAPNFNGVVTLTVNATDSASQAASTQVVITVLDLNDPPTLTISSDNVTALAGFFPITIYSTATDIEDGTPPISVQASAPGVVSVNFFDGIIILSPIETGSGRTTLTFTATDKANATAIQTMAVNVIVTPSATPTLTVSNNFISVLEDFSPNILIRTTANDADQATLVITVSSFTHVVDAVISSQGLTLSPVLNLFGNTTLTIRAIDVGGLFASTEVVVLVQSVNDPPVLTISATAVTLVSALNAPPTVLSISAIDVEDGPLTISVSTGLSVIDTTITKTSLSIARRGFGDYGQVFGHQTGAGPQVVLTLNSNDSDGTAVSTNVTVTVPAFFNITTGTKFLDMGWTDFAPVFTSIPYLNFFSRDSHRYRLVNSIDGVSGFVNWGSNGDIRLFPENKRLGDIYEQSTAQGFVALHRYIPKANDPLFSVTSFTTEPFNRYTHQHNTVRLTNADLQSMIGRFSANNSNQFDYFGASISLSADGNTLAIGAPSEDSATLGISTTTSNDNNLLGAGAVYVYRRNGGVWLFQAYIKTPFHAFYFGRSWGTAFGRSVSLSADGNTLAVGADDYASGFTTIPGIAHVYRFGTASNAWALQRTVRPTYENVNIDTAFGASVSLSADGNTLAVGASGDPSSTMGIRSSQPIGTASPNSGAVYVFSYTTASNTWPLQAYIKASDTRAADRFGMAVSLSADGNTLAVGASGEDSSSIGVGGAQNNINALDSGAVYVFRFTTASNTWAQQAYIKASNTGSGDGFGGSVDIRDNGNALIVGAIGEDSGSTGVNAVQDQGPSVNDSGAAYYFVFNNGTWSQQSFIKASNTGNGDNFGSSVGISDNGGTIAVGAMNEDGDLSGVSTRIRIGGDTQNSGTDVGAVYVYEFPNGILSQISYVKSKTANNNAHFGQTMSVNGDGASIAVGEPETLSFSGAAYLY